MTAPIVSNGTAWFDQGVNAFRKGCDFDRLDSFWNASCEFTTAAKLFDLAAKNFMTTAERRMAEKRAVQARKCATQATADFDRS